MLAYAYNIMIYRGVGAPGHGREVVNALNDTYKRFISMVTETVQLPGASAHDTKMEMHTYTVNTDISIAR